MYLDRKSSEAIKGLLILLIVFGHNHVLCPNDVSGGLMEYLYTFHVMGFFILPFFYGREINDLWYKIQTTFVKCWIPYLWACILCWLAFSIFRHNFEFGWQHILAFFNGTQTPIRKYFGFVFPWFLPTFCSFSIMLMLGRKYKYVNWAFFILSVATFFFTWEHFFVFKNTVPFGIGLAIHYYASGIIAFSLHKISRWSKYVGAVLFVVMSLCWWSNVNLGFYLNFMPSFFFLALICLLPCFNNKYIRCLGKYSLGIYLLHVFVVNATYFLLPQSVLWGVMGFLISVLVPLAITCYIYKKNILRKLLFPTSFGEFINNK